MSRDINFILIIMALENIKNYNLDKSDYKQKNLNNHTSINKSNVLYFPSKKVRNRSIEAV